MNELEDISGFYQKMKNVETYQNLSSSRYIVGHRNLLCTVLIILTKDTKNVIMQRMITKKLCKTAKADIKVWLPLHSKNCKWDNRRSDDFDVRLCNLPHRKGGYNPFILILDSSKSSAKQFRNTADQVCASA